MVLERQREPLRPAELPDPQPGAGQVLISVSACGVCRTDLHIVDGELDRAEAAARPGAPDRRHGGRGGGGGGALRASASGSGCPGSAGPAASAATAAAAARTSATAPASPATTSTAATPSWPSPTSASASRFPRAIPDEQAAPLLCAGLIGYRALRLVGDAERIGFYGFGASAHILCQVAVHQGRRVFAFTREGDEEAQAFARELGAEWAGSSERAAAGGDRRRDRLRPGRRADDGGAAGQRQGRADHQRRHPHERHPGLPLRAALGRARRSARSPT